mmetsp:Transcript_7075/g.18009  ORF Transcript_7075/g.18009 Transcript_7075/m.18009 type:complete len:85 (-) Transcript_7075:128-382(-)
MGRNEPSWELGPNEEPYETFIERTVEEWAEWADDDFTWSSANASGNYKPAQSTPSQETIPEADNDTESLEDFLDRIDGEWADWK